MATNEAITIIAIRFGIDALKPEQEYVIKAFMGGTYSYAYNRLWYIALFCMVTIIMHTCSHFLGLETLPLSSTVFVCLRCIHWWWISIGGWRSKDCQWSILIENAFNGKAQLVFISTVALLTISTGEKCFLPRCSEWLPVKPLQSNIWDVWHHWVISVNTKTLDLLKHHFPNTQQYSSPLQTGVRQ